MEARKPATVLQLPTDVWQRVCSLVTTREWVTSCGLACKYFQQLQPLQIKVQSRVSTIVAFPEDVPGNLDSTIRWMVHHWEDSHAVDLTTYPLGNKNLSANITRLLKSVGTRAQGARAKPYAPTALRVFKGVFISHPLVFKAMMEEFDLGRPDPNTLEGPLERLCACLLPLMSRLTALNLFIPRAPQLPPFDKLEHLELHSIDFNGVQRSLTRLHSLETLFLSCEQLESLLPALRLENLRKLRHVRLDDVFPAGLSLPPSCRLDVKGEADVMDKVIGATWQGALQHLHACTCRWTGIRKSASIQKLPSFMSRAAGCIQELSLVGATKLLSGTAKFSLRLDPGIFCNLKRLWMNSKELIEILIPAGIHLASLQIYTHTLNISFERPIVSCANLTDVTLFYRKSGALSGAELLLELLTNKGVCVRSSIPLQQVEILTSMARSPYGDNHEYWEHIDHYNGVPPSCSCTMCWACTRRGVLQHASV